MGSAVLLSKCSHTKEILKMGPPLELTILLVILSPWSSFAAGEKSLTATRGGIAPLGSEMTLKFVTGQEKWTICYWYRYEIGEEKPDNCMFMNTTGQVTTTCDPPSFGDVISLAETNSTECTIKISNLTKLDSCSWRARVDAQMENTEINVTVATKPTKIILASVPEVSVAGENTTVECKAEGGSPKPSLDITVSPAIGDITSDNSATNENQISSKLNFKPTVDNNGAQVDCKVVQLDGEGQPLFPEQNAPTLMLNVTYKPQPSEKTVLRAKEGGNVTAQVTIKANPDPNSVKWTLHYAKDPVTNKTKPNLVLADKGTNYQVSLVATANQTLSHDAKVVMTNLTPSDNGNLELEVENSVGKQTYIFEIKVKGADEPDDEEGGGGLSGGSIAIIIIAVIVVVLVGSIVAYKKFYLRSNETTPLR